MIRGDRSPKLQLANSKLRSRYLQTGSSQRLEPCFAQNIDAQNVGMDRCIAGFAGGGGDAMTGLFRRLVTVARGLISRWGNRWPAATTSLLALISSAFR
mmetsp:Transcript_12877/g.30165  ORF Transcript_12877/g.30165 Transcript_12877/m.30165 type:complete len:99 (+) Transcript_12877:11-307(+)